MMTMTAFHPDGSADPDRVLEDEAIAVRRAQRVVIARADRAGRGRRRADDAAVSRGRARAVAGEPGAIDAFEALGAARPTTRWTDDAWAEAARLAERAGDFARARRDLAQAIATATDDQLATRARGDLARLDAIAGATGQWSAVAAAHERLVARIAAPRRSEARARRASRRWSGRTRAIRALRPRCSRSRAAGSATATSSARSRWLREAAGAPAPAVDREHAIAELARGEIRAGELAAARAAIAAVARSIRRSRARWAARSTRAQPPPLAALGVVARRSRRSRVGARGGAAPRRGRAGGPRRAARAAAGRGAVLRADRGRARDRRGDRQSAGRARGARDRDRRRGGRWISGAMLDTERARHGRIGARRAAVHAALAAVAVIAATYLAIDSDRMIDLVVETWKNGPAMR